MERDALGTMPLEGPLLQLPGKWFLNELQRHNRCIREAWSTVRSSPVLNPLTSVTFEHQSSCKCPHLQESLQFNDLMTIALPPTLEVHLIKEKPEKWAKGIHNLIYVISSGTWKNLPCWDRKEQSVWRKNQDKVMWFMCPPRIIKGPLSNYSIRPGMCFLVQSRCCL